MTTILLRRGTANEWSTVNPILANGEPGTETDTNLLKVGDGQTDWNSLPFTYETDNAWILSGSGQASGVPPRGVGSTYVDTTETAGAVRWVYTSSGWVVEYGDTELRDISAEINLRGDGIVHTATVQRTGPTVDVYLDVTSPSDTTAPWTPWTMPLGFRIQQTRSGGVVFYQESISGAGIVNDSGDILLYNLTANKRDRMWIRVTAEPDPAWPTTLPGVSA